jgi:RND family efflux transporter MFP subunit
VVLTLLTLILPAAVFAIRANRPTVTVANLQTYTVARGDLDVSVSAVGKVSADRSASLSFTVPGRIAGLIVQEGDTVAAGDVMAWQADEAQKIALQQAQLSLQLAQLQKDKLMAGPDEAQLAVAQANIDSAMGAVRSVQNAVSPDSLRAAELASQQAQAALEAAQHDRAFGNGTQEQVDLLDAKVGQASFNAEIARLNVQSLQSSNSGALSAAYARVAQAQAALDQLKAGATDAEISRADAVIAQAQVALDRAQAAEDRTQLSAPFDGIITGVSIEVGALVAPGMTAITIADVSPLHLNVQVDEVDVRRISVGLAAMVKLDALPDVQLPATIQDVALVSNNDNGIVSYDATVRLDNDDPHVRIGMTADAAVVVESHKDVLIVPNQYIRLDRQRNQAYVNLVKPDGTLQEVPVMLGLQGQERSEVSDGLKAGDVIGVDLAADRISLFGG